MSRSQRKRGGEVRARGQRGGGGDSRPALFEPFDVVAELQRRPQLQAQVLHHHLALQEEQGVSVDLLKGIAPA